MHLFSNILVKMKNLNSQHIIAMQNIRNLYSQAQQQSKQSSEKLTSQRCKELLAYAESQYENMIALNDFTHLDEIIFFRDKFQQMSDACDEAERNHRSKNSLRIALSTILKDSYAQTATIGNQQIDRQAQKNKNKQPNPNSSLANFFQKKQKDILRSNPSFKSLLQSIPRNPKKYGVKFNPSSKIGNKINQDSFGEIEKLKQEVDNLRNELSFKNNEENRKIQQVKFQRQRYERSIQQLSKRILDLKQQNIFLKQNINHNQNKEISSYKYLPDYPTKSPPDLNQSSQHYGLIFKPNDITYLQKKTNKILSTSPFSLQQKNPLGDPNFKQRNNKALNQPKNKSPLFQQPYKNEPIQQKHKQIRAVDSQYYFRTSNHKFNKSQVFDQAKNIAIRSKISFFKPSMIIYRGKYFEVAVKSVDIVRFQTKKLIIFVNNRQDTQKNVKVSYKYDRNSFQINQSKKLVRIQGNTQGKQQIVVKFVNAYNFDSMVEVQLTVESKSIYFLLPTMFIDFLDRKPQQNKKGVYELERVNPIHQFSNLNLAQEIIHLQKIEQEMYQTGRVYAISKFYQGYVYLRWIGSNVQVETIPSWKLFLSYLLLRNY